MATARESALVVPVPDAEPIVGSWRAELDRAAGWGVPAHVTVLYPFVDPDALSDGVIDTLAAVFDRFASFRFDLTELRRFGDDVVYLAPEPEQPFRDLTAAVAAEWPNHPPYGGVHDDVIPHLTLAEGPQDRRRIDAAITEVEPHLPLAMQASEVWLMAGDYQPNAWLIIHRFPLPGPPAA